MSSKGFWTSYIMMEHNRMKRRSTSLLVMSVCYGLATIGGQTVSLLKGSNVRFSDGCRPMTARLRVGSLATMAVSAENVVLANQELARRRKSEDEVFQPTTSELTGSLAGGLAVSALCAHQIVTGASLVHRYPISRYERTMNVSSIIIGAHTAATAVNKLWARRQIP